MLNNPSSQPLLPGLQLDEPQLPQADPSRPPSLSSQINDQLPESQQLSSANLARWFEHDTGATPQSPNGPVRVRKRVQPGNEQVKHRRTRSGCYTCRSRRVKCDETHPVCKRCRKGSRECIYPEPTSATQATPGSRLGQPRRMTIESVSSSDDYEEEPESPVALEKKRSISNIKSTTRRQSRNQIKTEHLKESSLSPSTDDMSQPRSGYTLSTNTSLEDPPWSYLPQDQRFFLDYHLRYITHHHYFFKHDPSSFVHTTLLEIALENDPLLYAVVGFAAFQHTVKKPNGKIPDFLGYYNRSVSLLRKSLQASQKRTDATILTILQLAAFEEYLGDWVNLIGHQKAAYEMLRELYSPNTVMQTETSRKILAWYTRFDVFASLMAGNATTLGIEWFLAAAEWYDQRSLANPEDIDLQVDAQFAQHKVIGVEMAQLFAKLPKGEISIPDFMHENELLGQRIKAGKSAVDPLLMMPEHKVYSFEGAPPLDPDDIVDPYQPGMMLKGPLFSVNYMLMDWYAIEGMHKYQTSLILQQPPPADLVRIALEQCRILESIEYWPGSPHGSLLPTQASLALICLFTAREERYTMWCRRKLAKIESQGFIFPLTFRTKMAELWSLPSCQHWWLPDDCEYPPIIRSIRSFIEERIMKVRSQGDEDIRSIRAMFAKLSHDDSPKESPESLKYGSTSSDGNELESHSMVVNMTDVDFDTGTLGRIVERDARQDDLHSPFDKADL